MRTFQARDEWFNSLRPLQFFPRIQAVLAVTHILLITCPDQVGLIHSVTGTLLGHGLNIVSNAEFVDPVLNAFFMRTEFTGPVERKALLDELHGSLPAASHVRITSTLPKNVVILASREPHCLGDLLLRHSNQELDFHVQAVLSNHSGLSSLVRRFDIPFHHLPCTSDDRQEHESRLLSVLGALRPDYLVLAKYMRVLTPEFTNQFPNRIINIHHSFLPAFIGASPYKQAYDRGVKIIGATAHFVNEHLDDGPIIVQSVLPVTHAHTASSMAQKGREIEKLVLARALQLVLEDRVFVHGKRTVIFE